MQNMYIGMMHFYPMELLIFLRNFTPSSSDEEEDEDEDFLNLDLEEVRSIVVWRTLERELVVLLNLVGLSLSWCLIINDLKY